MASEPDPYDDFHRDLATAEGMRDHEPDESERAFPEPAPTPAKV